MYYVPQSSEHKMLKSTKNYNIYSVPLIGAALNIKTFCFNIQNTKVTNPIL